MTEQTVPCVDIAPGADGLNVLDPMRIANELAALANAGGGAFLMQVGTTGECSIDELVRRLDAVQALVVSAADQYVSPELVLSTEKWWLAAGYDNRPVALRIVVERMGARHCGPGGPRLLDGRERRVALQTASP